MRWQRGESREDVEDRRDEAPSRGGLPFGTGKLGIGGILLLLVLSIVFKKNFFALLGTSSSVDSPPRSAPADPSRKAAEEPLLDFVTFVINDGQRTWNSMFDSARRPYRKAKLVVFHDAVRSGCGEAEASTGPFYCPADEKVYIDLGFYEELRRKLGAPGDFAQAYVVAHELGHHIQHLLGTDEAMRRQQEAHPRSRNELSVALELQADCFAGIWAHGTERRELLEAGDLEEGLNAAGAVGDDRLQNMATGRVAPESFTHGSSQQRISWFRKGYESGDVSRCDTFRELSSR